MPDLKDQIRTYYEATTVPLDIEAITIDADTVLVGPIPHAAQRRNAMRTVPPEVQQQTPWWKGPRIALGVVMSAAVVVLAVFAIVKLTAPGDAVNVARSGNDPAAVIQTYIEAYNAKDIDGIMALFTEESVVTGHPFGSEATSLARIRTLQNLDMNAAAAEDAYTISNIEVAGNTVTWDHVWNGDGGRFCAEGHTAIVEDGKIISWAFAAGAQPHSCP